MNRYVHKDAGSDDNDGLSPATPWQSLKNSASRLGPGKTLNVLRASSPYMDRFTTVVHGEPNNPISIVTPDRAVIGGGGLIFNADFWNVDGFHFEAFPSAAVVIGHGRTAHHVNVRDCNFFHSTRSGVWLNYTEDVSVTGCHFRDLRARVIGTDRNALNFFYAANRVLIARCKFEDAGSDDIHILPVGHHGFCGNIRIEDCRFWVNRPYRSVPWQNIYNDMGENGIDVKGCDGPVFIRRCQFAGFREIMEPQDSSSDHGCGTAIQAHCDARDIKIWDVHIKDCRRGVRVNPNVSPSVGPVYIGKFTTHNVEEPISIRPGWEHVVHELHEDPLPNGNGGNDMGIVETLRTKAAELRAIAAALEAFDATEIRTIAAAIDAAADNLIEADQLADQLADKL